MLKRLAIYASFVRFSHSVFALPFALAGALLAAQRAQGPTRRGGWPWRGQILFWILVAMVAARSAAMGFNRLADAPMDALNPRTAKRELPRGAMSRREAVVFVAVASAAFVFAAWQLDPLCFALSPIALAIVFWYSLAKRYTTWTQLFLGLAMAVAPVGGWLAVGGRGGWEPWLLAAAIGTWVGGFDVCTPARISTSTGRTGFARFPSGSACRRRSRSPGRCTSSPSPASSRWRSSRRSARVYLGGVAVVAAMLVYEQSLVRADDLSRVKLAFDLNGYVGILYLWSWWCRCMAERSGSWRSRSPGRAAPSTPRARWRPCSSAACTSS